jgi:hypothetical protein
MMNFERGLKGSDIILAFGWRGTEENYENPNWGSWHLSQDLKSDSSRVENTSVTARVNLHHIVLLIGFRWPHCLHIEIFQPEV